MRADVVHGDERRDRFLGCLLGVAAGDALGAPFEGSPRVRRADVEQWADAEAPLRWTDDTHMTIGLAQSLILQGGFDGEHMAFEFARNYRAQPWRGYGAGPPQVFAALEQGVSWDEAAARLFDGQGSFGNGAAMRVAPAGLVAPADFARIEQLARATARLTHAHELAQQGAALQAGAVAWLVTARSRPDGDDGPNPIDDLRRLAPAPEFQRQLDRVAAMETDAPAAEVAGRIGHGIAAVEAVPAALHAFLRHPFSLRDAVIDAVTLGGDTDTIAAMTGALSGAFLGGQAIPTSWRDRLEAADDLEQVAADLFDRWAEGVFDAAIPAPTDGG
jgi:poly(ADP-ribose) glycohydrolase ARH3